MIAEAHHWDERIKLLNLVTNCVAKLILSIGLVMDGSGRVM